MPSDAATRWIGLLLLVVALVGAMFFNILKLQSLSFHTREFPFYLQFAAKALDPDLSSQYALNPQGHNFLGLGGVEGTRGIYQAIHFEPVKFVYAALHMVLPTPLSTLTFVAAVYFAPVPYLIVVYPARRAADRRWILLVVAAYVACPLSLLAISYDARPVVMLGPVFLMLVVSIHVGRPFRETIVLFVLLMLIREEALLFAGAAIAYNLARRDQADGRVGTTLQLGGIRAAWAMTTAVYFAWAGYGVGDRFNLIGSLAPALRWPVLLGVGVAGGAATVVWRYLRRHGRNSRTVWEIAAYSTIFLPFASELIQHHNDRRTFIRHDLTEALWRVVDTYVNSPQSALSFAAIVALGILLWDGVRRPVLRSSLQGCAALLVVVSVYTFAARWPAVEMQAMAERRGPATLVFDLRETTDPYGTHVLADYATYQAYYDYEHVYVYNRLPWYLVSDDEARFHPANLTTLQRLTREQIEYVAISNESRESIDELLSLVGMTPVKVVENEQFTVMRLR